MWNLPPPPGFQGLHPDKPLHIYERHLPHWRQEGATYFATFRLGDSLPQAKLNEIQRIREEFSLRHKLPYTHSELEILTRELGVRVENWLDLGYGACYLKHQEHAVHLVDALHHFDLDPHLRSALAGSSRAVINGNSGDMTANIAPRYELNCYVIMANHVHAIVRPLDGTSHSLESIIGGWKQYTATRINNSLGLRGALWQQEAFDRLIRDEEHLWRAIQYIGNNPKRAGLTLASCPLWIRPEWQALGWNFE